MSTPTPNDDSTRIIPPHRWPADATPDEKIYSLETSRAAELHWDADTKEFVEVFVQPDLDTKPDYPAQTGTYVEIAAEAKRLNAAQLISGFIAWVFTPALVEPQTAR